MNEKEKTRMRMNRFPIFRTSARICVVGLLLGLVSAMTGTAGADEQLEVTPPGTLEFVGENAITSENGFFHSWHVIESSIDPVALGESYAIIEIDLSSVDTGINRRDNHLRDPDFFEVENYPTARVRVHSAVQSGVTDSAAGRFTAQFDIDLQGVKKTVPGELVVASEAPLTFEGSLVVDRMDFGVGAKPSRWNPMSVKAKMPVRFRIEL